MGANDLTVAAILRQLDQYAVEEKFPHLEARGGCQPAAWRLHAYRAPGRWALAVEQLSFYRDTATIDNDVYTYGNCLALGPGLHEEGMLCPTDDGPEGPTFDVDSAADWGLVHPGARTILIRGRVVPLDLRPRALAVKGIRLSQPPRATGAELLRSLLPEHRDLLLASDEELARLLPPGLPCLLKLDEWCHPDTAAGERPSECETFRLLAEVLVSGDPQRYQPTEEPNTDWRLWADKGSEG
jgi:hypothetical protein